MIEPIYIFLLVALVVSVTIAMLVLPNILLISHKKKLFAVLGKFQKALLKFLTAFQWKEPKRRHRLKRLSLPDFSHNGQPRQFAWIFLHQYKS